MKHVGLVAIAVVAVIGVQGWLLAQTQKPVGQKPTMKPTHRQTGLSTWDKIFITKATQGGIAEVRLGRLASQRAHNPAVKQFGRHMVVDHSKANAQLKQIAAREAMMVPRDTDAKHKAVQTRLLRLSGTAFDRAYMQEMVKDHVESVSLFQQETAKGKAPNIKSWATKTLPVLQMHLQMAQRLNHQVNGSKGAR